MNTIISSPATLENKKDFEEFVKSLIDEKIDSPIVNKSHINSIIVHTRKVGHFYNFHIKMKYKNIDFQLLKKDKNPFKAASLAIKGLRRMYLDNGKKMLTRYNIGELGQLNFSSEAS